MAHSPAKPAKPLTWLTHQAQRALQSKHSSLTTRLSLGCIAFGMVLMAVQYFANRSLWYDEASLAINLVNRSYGELLERLRYSQAAPPLFLWFNKLAVQLAGNDERVLRFLPFVSGLGSLFLLYRLARRYVGGLTTFVALALFSTSAYGTYFATEFKPYMVDVVVGLGFFQILIELKDTTLTRFKNFSLGIAGALLIWFSYPIIFIMAAVELVGVLQTPIRQWGRRMVNRLGMYGLWLAGFAGLYSISISQTLTNDKLVESWSARYPDSFLDVVWGLDAFSRFFYRPMGFPGVPGVIAMVVFVVGMVSLYRRDRPHFWMLNAPFLITLFASYLHQYPFRDRLLLFLAPYGFLMIAEGITWLMSRLEQQRWLGFLGLLFGLSLLLPSFTSASQKLVQPDRFLKHHVRPIIAEIQQDWQPDDRLYVYSHAVRQFQYYSPRFRFFPADLQLGSQPIPKRVSSNSDSTDSDRAFVPDELKLYMQGRTWILLSMRDKNVSDRLLSELDQQGKRLKTIHKPSALGVLYRFSEEISSTLPPSFPSN